MTATKSSDWLGPAKVPGLASVVIPVRNRAALILHTLDSIFAQTFRPIEAVVVDDGSADGTPDAVEKWITTHADDPAFTLCLLRQPRRGVSAARNAGTVVSRGEFIQYFDSDDLMRPEKLAKSIAVLRAQSELGFVMCDHTMFHDENGKVVIDDTECGKFSQRDHTPEGHLRQICMNPDTPCFRRESLSAVGKWAEDLSSTEDFEFCFRVLLTLQGIWLPEVLCDMRHTPYSLSSGEAKKTTKYWEDYIRVCDRIEEIAQQRGIYSEAFIDALCQRLQHYVHKVSQKKYWAAYDILTSWMLDNRVAGMQRTRLTLQRNWLRLRGKFNPFINHEKISISLLKKITRCTPKKYRSPLLLQTQILEKNIASISKRKVQKRIRKKGTFTGVTNIPREVPLIVSLTTSPDRMGDAYYAILSLLNQTIQPDAVVLWLSQKEYPRGEQDVLPQILSLKKAGLTIKFTQDMKAHNKILPALREYPDAVLVTADDNIYNGRHWLEKLYTNYLATPQHIHCHRADEVRFDSKGKILPQEEWRQAMEWNQSDPSILNFPMPGGGTLYPPRCLHEDVTREDLFMQFSPAADDLWLWAMAILNGTKVHVVQRNESKSTYVTPARALEKNQNTCDHTQQLQTLLQHYGLEQKLWQTFQYEHKITGCACNIESDTLPTR